MVFVGIDLLPQAGDFESRVGSYQVGILFAYDAAGPERFDGPPHGLRAAKEIGDCLSVQTLVQTGAPVAEQVEHDCLEIPGGGRFERPATRMDLERATVFGRFVAVTSYATLPNSP